MFLRQGRMVSERKSGTLEISGSCGFCPTLPHAKPAKPAPSWENSSRCEIGTSFALGAPVNSTKEIKRYSTPFLINSDFNLSVSVMVFSRSRFLFLVRHRRCGLLSNQLSGGKPSRRERLDQARRLPGGNQCCHTLAGNRSCLESVSPPSHIYIKVTDLLRSAHNRGEV